MSSWQHGIRQRLDGKLGKARKMFLIAGNYLFSYHCISLLLKESAIFFSTSYPLPSPSRANLYSNETCEWARYLVKQ